jgi:alpha-L-fucosidase
MKRILLICLLTFILTNSITSQTKYEPSWASIDARPTPTWFEDAKFGIFIHWGLFSVPGWGPTAQDSVGVYDRYAEWYWKGLTDPNRKGYKAFNKFHNSTYGKDFKYQDFAKDFKCELFDPSQWADVFKDAGAKYVVMTSKHHEGFTMWPSKQSWNWNAVDLNPHMDLAGGLISKVKAKGLKMGFYYSLYEWFNPLYNTDVDKYVDEHMIPQMKDLVNSYKPDLVWTDGEWDYPSEKWKSTQFLAWLYNDSPVKNDVVVNDRWGKETRGKHGGIYTTEYDLVHDANSSGMEMNHPWEECRGIGSSFGVNRKEMLDDYSTSAQLIHILINKVARGGNLLLNIGPNADGTIPVIMQQRLRDIGTWLKVNGEAIYGTRKWTAAPKITKDTKQYFTKKGSDLYLIITEWSDKPIEIDNIFTLKNVNLLGYKEAIKYSVNKSKLSIVPPALSPSSNPCEHAWAFKLTGATLAGK